MSNKMPMPQFAAFSPMAPRAGMMYAARKMRRMSAEPRTRASTIAAMKRLPMPASGNSMETSSGVSMLSWSPIGSMAIILSNQWLQKRRPYWDRLSWLLNQAAASGVGQLSRAELRETALLYRQAASDLSTLRQDSTARAYAELVNQLLARAHHIIYSSRRKGFRRVFDFLYDGYPAIVQRQFRYVLLSLAILLAGGALGTVLTLARPEFMRHMLGPQMADTIEHHKMWTQSRIGCAGSQQRHHDEQHYRVLYLVCRRYRFRPGAIWSMFNNGMLLGVIGVACAQHGMALDLWSFVAPHGSLELPSIVLAGAAGLRLGRGVAFPGLYRWRDSIALAGVEATRMVAGTIPLLDYCRHAGGVFLAFRGACLA